MSDLATFYDRNAEFVATFDHGDLVIKPAIMTVILTCVDARVDPAHYARLGLGDALVLRNVGARATDTALLEVAVLFNLMKLGAGGVAPHMGLAIIQHTDCGMAKFAVPQVAEAITAIFGTPDVVETYAIPDLAETVRADVSKALDVLPAGITVSGHVYDVSNGGLEQIVDPAAS